MNFRLKFALLAAFCILSRAPALRAQDAPPDVPTSELELQVAALTTLDELDATAAQIQKLQKLALGTASPVPAAKPEASSAEYHTALRTLRDALVNQEDEKIDAARDKVDDLRDSEKIDPDLDFPTSDSARLRAVAALKIWGTSQIAAYIAEHADEIPDAADTISDALDQCHDGADQDFSSLREEAASQVAMLAAGLDEKAGAPIAQQVRDLLNQARNMPEKQFDNRRPQLDQRAMQITKSIDSFEALHHWLEREMADLLSNPRIDMVLAARIRTENQH